MQGCLQVILWERVKAFASIVTIDSESMHVDSTNITMDEEEEGPFRDYGPMFVGNIVEYSNSIEDEGEKDEQEKQDDENIRKEVRVVTQKAEEDKLKNTWKNHARQSIDVMVKEISYSGSGIILVVIIC